MADPGGIATGEAPVARMRGLRRALLAALLIAACARMAPPPGGPPRRIPPVLLGTFPDSGTAPCDLRTAAEFRFDEVTSDAGQPNFGFGDGTLEKLIMLSPDTAVPTVAWHRDRITVRPRAGWRKNVVYRIELLPGVLDLHQNVSKTGGVIAFTVCGPKPTRILSGRVIDWMSARAVPSALVEVMHLPDSARYRTIADSTGRFRIDALPDGPYLVVATVDQNRDHKRNAGEPWDSVRVSATRDTVGEIWTFPRDTLPPRIQDVARIDSEFISVTFTKPVDPGLRLDTTSIRVGLLPDTTSIAPLEAFPKAYSDSIHKAAIVRTPAADSVFRRDSLKNDSIARARPAPVTPNLRASPPPDLPLQKRPVLGNVIVIRTRGRVQANQSYFVELRNVRTAGGQTGPPVGKTLLKAKPPTAADSARMRADSARVKADSLKADSARKAKPDSLKPAPIRKPKTDSLAAMVKPR